MSGWVKGGDHWGETGQNPHFKRPFHFLCCVNLKLGNSSANSSVSNNDPPNCTLLIVP